MIAIIIKNDGSGDVFVGNYIYEVMVNDRIIAQGNIKKHTRSWGWKSLVYHLLSKEK
jgi:hypothetical protein